MGKPRAVMPDLVRATRTFRHTVDSALRSLRRRGLDTRVVLESAGPDRPYGTPDSPYGTPDSPYDTPDSPYDSRAHAPPDWPRGTVVRQHPAPNAPLEPGDFITLWVTGPSGLLSLPYAMRTATRPVAAPDGGGAEPDRPRRGEVGADRLFALFDHQVLALVHRVRQAGEYLALREDAPETARRWIEDVFALRPQEWPRDRWHRLARLLPRLHRVAGRPEGVQAAFREVLGLSVLRVEARIREVPLARGECTRLGERASRLSLDAVVGQGVLAQAETAVVIHVATPRELRLHASEDLRRQRLLLYGLLLPAHLDATRVIERWLVGLPLGYARLAGADEGASLGAGPEPIRVPPSGALA